MMSTLLYHPTDWETCTRQIIAAEKLYGVIQVDVMKRRQYGLNAGEALIWSLDVFPDHRRSGIGKTLLHEAESYASGMGCKYAFVEWTKGEAAPWVLQWYKRCGYKPYAQFDKTTRLRKQLL